MIGIDLIENYAPCIYWQKRKDGIEDKQRT